MTIECARAMGYIDHGYKLDNGFFHSGDVIMCPQCKGSVDKVNISKIECHGAMIDCEWDYRCNGCFETLGRFYYGHYEYHFLER